MISRAVAGGPISWVLSEGDKRDSKGSMLDSEGVFLIIRMRSKYTQPSLDRGRSYFAPEPASRTRPRRTLRHVDLACRKGDRSFKKVLQAGANRRGPRGWAGRVSHVDGFRVRPIRLKSPRLGEKFSFSDILLGPQTRRQHMSHKATNCISVTV
ncbi:hypothetical protein F4777DRAFT_68338 [Nemania sp. FL0916]|nr:hypothetical protein F4777DRAFT_68338 [Nemania sp. FL0916]